MSTSKLRADGEVHLLVFRSSGEGAVATALVPPAHRLDRCILAGRSGMDKLLTGQQETAGARPAVQSRTGRPFDEPQTQDKFSRSLPVSLPLASR